MTEKVYLQTGSFWKRCTQWHGHPSPMQHGRIPSGHHVAWSDQFLRDEGDHSPQPLACVPYIIFLRSCGAWRRKILYKDFFVMLLCSSSFSKLCITFSTINFLGAEQDPMLKSSWIGGKWISLTSDWAVPPSLLVVLHFHNSASMSDTLNLTSQPKELLVLADQVLVSRHKHDLLSRSVPQHVRSATWLACLFGKS